jgi:hypothetical protein
MPELLPEVRMCTNYVNEIVDAMLILRRTDRTKQYYGERQLIAEVYADEKEATTVWLHFAHNVSDCPLKLLMYCEEELLRAGKKLPPKPLLMQERITEAA